MKIALKKINRICLVVLVAMLVLHSSAIMAACDTPDGVKKPPALAMQIPYGQLTLTRAREIALEGSPHLLSMIARIDQAKAVADQARADLWPTVTVHAGYDLNDSSAYPDWNPKTRAEQSYKHTSAGVQVNYLLFDGFSRRASIIAARARVTSSEELRNEAGRLLAESVATTYYQAQLAVEAMKIARQNALFNRNLESDAEKRCLIGDIPQADYLNFSVKSLQAENHFLEAKRSFSVVCTILAKLMALEEPNLSKEMYPVAADPVTTLAKLPELADELEYALHHRPDLLALSAQRQALLQDEKKHRGRYFPKLSAHGSYDYDKYTDYGSKDQDEHDSSIGLRLTWDLYNGGIRSAQIRQTRAQLKQLQRQKEQKILEIKAALKNALVKAESSHEVYQRERYTLILVKKIRDNVERSYKAGATTLTRLNEAQTDLVSVSAAVATSRINYLQQLENLRSESGRILAGF